MNIIKDENISAKNIGVRHFFLILIVTSICLLCVACSGKKVYDNFSLRNEIKLGDSINTVQEKESLEPFKEYWDDKTRITFLGNVEGRTARVHYFFTDDKLTDLFMTYDFETCIVFTEDDSKDQFNKLKNTLVQKYGQPDNTSLDSVYPVRGKAFAFSAATFMAFTGEYFNTQKSGYDSICEWIVETQEGKVKIDLLRYHTLLSIENHTRDDYYVGLSFHSFTDEEYEANKQDTTKIFHADPAYIYTDSEITNLAEDIETYSLIPMSRASKKHEPKSSSGSGSRSKCAHPGCDNYAASSGDTIYCTQHSNKCASCGKYIDEDATFCMNCIEKALKR